MPFWLRRIRCFLLHDHGRTVCYGTVRVPVLLLRKDAEGRADFQKVLEFYARERGPVDQ